MLRDIEQQYDEGRDVSIGDVPELDPPARHIAKLWSTLRASTPAEQPIAMSSLALMVRDEGAFHLVLPLIQGMDSVLFDWQRDRRAEARKRAEAEAKPKQRGRGRARGR